jgi:hypothetical protein
MLNVCCSLCHNAFVALISLSPIWDEIALCFLSHARFIQKFRRLNIPLVFDSGSEKHIPPVTYWQFIGLCETFHV